MQGTGIVRRIDELGRVVIPKEIRKTLRIKEGDPLEIYTDKENLVISKYSPISSINDFVKIVADGIEEVTQKVCLITDNDTILYLSKGKMKDAIGLMLLLHKLFKGTHFEQEDIWMWKRDICEI